MVAAGLGLLLRDQPRRASTARVVGATVQVLEVEEVKDAKVKLGDCLEVLPTLEPESVQLFVTSPPLIRFMAAPAVSFQGPGCGVATADDSANAGTCASRLTCHRGHGAAITFRGALALGEMLNER